MTNKVTAIVDNLNNERVATIYKKEQTLSDKKTWVCKNCKWIKKRRTRNPCPRCEENNFEIDKLQDQTQTQEVEK